MTTSNPVLFGELSNHFTAAKAEAPSPLHYIYMIYDPYPPPPFPPHELGGRSPPPVAPAEDKGPPVCSGPSALTEALL